MPREISSRDYYPEGRSHRDVGYTRDYESERDRGGGSRGGTDVDPEFDARNYRLLKAKQEKALERQRLAKEQQRLSSSSGGAAPVGPEKEHHDYDDYQMMRDQRPKKRNKSSKKKKRRHRDEDRRQSRRSRGALVEYDDVSSGSEMYSDSADSASQGLSHHSHHSSHRTSSSRSRVSPPPEKRRRAASPGSAIQEYRKELMSRSHSNSPAHVSRERSPSSRGSGKSRKHRVPAADASPPPKASVPKAYAEPPKAYRAGEPASPGGARSRHRSSRSPSPQPKKYSSPVSPHK